MNLLNYSNGWGHLAMSIFMTIAGLFLIVYPGLPASTQGIGVGLVLAVQAAWFVPGAAKQVAVEIVKAIPTLAQATNAGAVAGAAAAAATTTATAAVQVGSSTPPVDMDATQKIPVVKP